MLRIAVRRLAGGLGIVLAVVTLTFALITLAPGDPARLWIAPGAGAAELAAQRHALGLDQPAPVRYARWLARFVAGDWGVSLAQQRPVTAVIAAALPYTIELAGLSLLLTYVGGVLLGALQGFTRRPRLDSALTTLSLVVYGVPAYWLATMLVLVFVYAAARFAWPGWLQLPALGVAALDADFLSPAARFADRARHLVLPLLTLGLVGVAGTAPYVRAAVRDQRAKAFVRAAMARGATRLSVRLRHVLRNALPPVITMLGLSLPALFSGAVFVESVFAWPGMGRIMVDAVIARDYPVVLATTAVFAALVVAGNLCADLLHAWADPTLRRANA
jgi:peptide/nickel transport system permease protein